MSATITGGSYVLTPTLVKGYEAKRSARTVIHDILGRVDPDVTLRPAATRSGTLALVFVTEADAVEAVTAHADTEVFHLVDGDPASISMYYVVTGDVTITLDTDVYVWTVSVEYHEVFQ